MSSNYAAAAAAGVGGVGWRPPFTASQWQELEHQALIFKYLVAGVPVPPELLLPILKSFETMAARFYHHPTMGYCSVYGKKLDPEPWRCRRTDGKKWRCSKNAYPDSKYCERHMNRGRSRSRKPVETPSLSQSQPPTSSPSSTVTTLAPSGGGAAMGAAAAAAKSLPSGTAAGIPLQQSLGSSGGDDSAAQVCLTGSSALGQLQIGPGYYQMAGGSNRYLLGVKSEVDEHNFLSGSASGNARGLGIEASPDNPWQLMPSPQASSYPLSKNGDRHVSDSHNGGSPPRPRYSMRDFDHEASSSVSARQQQQHCFFGGELFDCKAPMKQQGHQPLLSFFDEWPPRTRDSWSDLEDDRSNRTSLSTTQLSISMPVASSDFSATSSRSSPDGGA